MVLCIRFVVHVLIFMKFHVERSLFEELVFTQLNKQTKVKQLNILFRHFQNITRESLI